MCFPGYYVPQVKALLAHISLGMRVSLTFSFKVHVRSYTVFALLLLLLLLATAAPFPAAILLVY